MGLVRAAGDGAGDDGLDQRAAQHDEQHRPQHQVLLRPQTQAQVAAAQKSQRDEQGGPIANAVGDRAADKRQQIQKRRKAAADVARLDVAVADDAGQKRRQHDEPAVVRGALGGLDDVGGPKSGGEAPADGAVLGRCGRYRLVGCAGQRSTRVTTWVGGGGCLRRARHRSIID